MKKKLLRLIMIPILTMIFVITGCASDKSLAESAARDGLSEAGIRGYSEEPGKAKKITMNDSESHQMIVKMRLLEYGMSPNLDDYRSTYLVEMKNDSGDVITVVVVNDDGETKSLLPENK